MRHAMKLFLITILMITGMLFASVLHAAVPATVQNIVTNTDEASTFVLIHGDVPFLVPVNAKDSDGNFTLSWDLVSGATSYQYRVCQNGTCGDWVVESVNSGTINIALSGNYHIEVRACNASGCGSSSTIGVEVTAPAANNASHSSWAKVGGSVPDASWSGDTPALTGNTNVGALEGSGGVSGGAATYSIPIVIPPGRAGMQPSVSLNYSSRSGNGIAGVGWSLSSGSSIHRCSATAAQDKYGRGVTYSTSDKLCLDGQRLIKYSGTYGVSGATYRTEMDSFAKIVQSGNINSSSDFTVYHKDGRISKYGSSTKAQHKAGGKTQIMSWAIAEVQDRSGNTISYDYYNYANGENLLSAIHYTGTNGAVGDRHVNFVYESRPDVSRSYLAGGLTQSSKRLQKIQTQYQSQTIREYQLRYNSSDASKRTLLQGVTECAVKGGSYCLPETVLEWNESSINYTLEKYGYINSFGSLVPILQDKRKIEDVLPHGDINGDGSTDWQKWFVDAEGRLKGSHPDLLKTCYKDYFTQKRMCVDADFNRDGKTDSWRRYNGKLQISYTHNTSSYSWFNTAIPLSSKGYLYQASDFNGDGWPDAVVKDNNQLKLYIHTKNTASPYQSGQAFYTYAVDNSGNEKTSAMFVGDMDGNGLPDFVESKFRAPVVTGSRGITAPQPFPQTLKLTKINTAGSVYFDAINLASMTIQGLTPELYAFNFFIDVSADGLPDWLTWQGSDQKVYLAINKGNGSFTSWQPLKLNLPSRSMHYFNAADQVVDYLNYPKYHAAFQVMDVNSDGRPELVMPDTRIVTACERLASYSDGVLSSRDYCGDELYGSIQTSFGPNQIPEPIDSAILDDSIYRFKAVHFSVNSNGVYWAQIKPTGLVGSAYQSASVDIFGNGLSDFIFTYGSSGYSELQAATEDMVGKPYGVYINRNKGTSANLKRYETVDTLRKITNGLQVVNEWDYRPLSTGDYKVSANDEFYERDDYIGTLADSFHFSSSTLTVASHKISNGIGGLNETRYRYRGAVYNFAGRGFQGFRSIIVDDLSDSDTNKRIRSVSDFHQKFPLSGKLEQTRSCLIKSGGEDCVTKPISKSLYTWDLWRDGTHQQTIDTASEDFAAKVLEGSTASTRYTVTPNQQRKLNYSTTSSSTANMTVANDWLSEQYQDFSFNSNGCPTSQQTRYQEPNGTNKTDSTTSILYQTADLSNWWLCKPQTQTVTTKAVSGRSSDYASVETGADVDKQITTTYNTWNANRKPTKITTQATQGQGTAKDLQSIVTTVYNTHGLPTKITSQGDHYTKADMAKRAVNTTYSSDGYFVKMVTNAKGHITTTTVDPTHGQATQITDPNGQVTAMSYDAFGRVRSTKAPGEPTQWMAYHWCLTYSGGCPSQTKYVLETAQLGSPKSREFKDSLNRTLMSQVQTFDSGSWNTQTVAFNHKGQKSFESIPHFVAGINSAESRGIKYVSYDALGRLTKKLTPQSNDSEMTTSYGYNGFVTSIKANGEKTLNMSRKYNGLGQLVWTKDALDGVTKYAYDGAGNPITLADAKGNPIYAKYNALGHKEYVKDPNMGQKLFWYNTFGEVEKELDANGTKLEYSYDTLGRMTQRWINGSRSAYWSWDNGNALNYRGLLHWEYDGSSNVGTHDRQENHYSYSKSSGGKLYRSQDRRRIYANGSYLDYDIEHAIDSNYGRPKSMKYGTTGLTLAYDYNDRGYMTTIKNANGGYVYQAIKNLDAHGKITKQLRANGVLTELSAYHVATGQMTLVQSQMTQGASRRHDISYSYDGFSNLDMQTMRTANGTMNSEDYVYDGLHRLTQSNRTLNTLGQTQTLNYAYDAVGNFTNKSDYGSGYLYGNVAKNLGGNAGPNAVRQVTKIGGGVASFNYDNNGNLISGDGKTLTYNAFNKPLTISKGNVTSRFSYGSDLMRYKQVKTGVAGGDITTYYIGKLLEKEIQGNSVQYKHYIGDVAIQTKKGLNWDIGFIHRDRLGSVVTITDQFGNVKEHRSFDPFGKPRKGDFSNPSHSTLSSVTGLRQYQRTTERGFTDHEHLDDHELIHMNGRAYDYNLGRFLSVDPFVQAPGNSQSMNPYSYIMNNPLAGTDPSGYACKDEGSPKKVCGSKPKKNKKERGRGRGFGWKTVYQAGNGAKLTHSVGVKGDAKKIEEIGSKLEEKGYNLSTGSTNEDGSANAMYTKTYSGNINGIKASISGATESVNNISTVGSAIGEGMKGISKYQITPQFSPAGGVATWHVLEAGSGKAGIRLNAVGNAFASLSKWSTRLGAVGFLGSTTANILDPSYSKSDVMWKAGYNASILAMGAYGGLPGVILGASYAYLDYRIQQDYGGWKNFANYNVSQFNNSIYNLKRDVNSFREQPNRSMHRLINIPYTGDLFKDK